MLNNQYIFTHSRLLLNNILASNAMAFSSLNPNQYLAVYFDFFAGPVMQFSNMCLIISIYWLLVSNILAIQWHPHHSIHINI